MKMQSLSGKGLLVLLGLLAHGAATMRGQSALDGFDPNANNLVLAVVVQPDGKILIGGGFSSVLGSARNRIARLNPDGTLDAAFDPNANGDVNAIALQADGQILVGGFFTNIGGQTRNRIARLDAATGSADSFDPNADGAVRSIAVQADGQILAGGQFTNIGGQSRSRIARLDATTGLADSFDPNANNTVFAIAVQADGKILAGGFFNGATSIGGQTRNRIARLDATTGLADSFDPNASGGVFAIALQADGKILAGGDFNGANSIGGATRNRIARLDATTGLADSFDPNASALASIFAIALQADARILVGGNFSTLAPNGGAAVARNNIARLETDGRLDQTLNLSTVGSVVTATAVQPDGKILIGGIFSEVLGVGRKNLTRLNTDGTLDTTFSPDPNDQVFAIAVQADGKILVGGDFSVIDGQTRNRIARLDTDGTLDTAFNPNASDDTVFSIVLQADGKILVGGNFNGPNSIGGATRNFIARLNPATGSADSFNPNANSTVFAIAVLADGSKILAGGDFTTIGGATRNSLARLDATTGLADSFDADAYGEIDSIALQADGKILVGGFFSGANIGGQPRNYIARLDPTTGLADSFNPDPNDTVTSIALQADGKILASGAFTVVGGQMRNRIARLNPATGSADSFDPDANMFVTSIALQADGKILAGGVFTSIGGQTRNLFARLSNDTAALQDLAATQSAITWALGGSSPQFRRVTFESSTDNMNYTSLGSGTADGSNWALIGLSLPIEQNLYIRARGHYGSAQTNGSESITESVRNAFVVAAPTPPPSTLGNISTRLRVETGDNVLIGGFIITGTQPKKVIVRAIGPSLPVVGKLADPTLELFGPNGLITSNDNWMDSTNKQEIIDSTIPPTSDLESAILTSLDPGPYTAIVRGADNTTGIALIEAYDLDLGADSILANISTRGLVQTGDNVMVGGIIVLGTDPQKVIVRAIGPSLPVPGALADPTLELHDANGMLFASNDNWRDTQEAEIIATTISPTDDLESAIVQTLAPAAYTAIVSGVNATTGVALVEVYALSP